MTTAPGAAVHVRRSRSAVVAIAWAAALVALVGLAVRQEHPSAHEPLLAAGVLLAALVATWVFTPRQKLGRAARWVVPTTALLVVVGVWNPWNLYAVTLLLDHPFVGGAAIAMFGFAWAWPEGCGRHRRLRRSLGVVVLLIAGTCIALGSLWAGANLAFGRTGYLASASSGGDVRIDFHGSGDCHAGTDAVVRSGRGVLLREGPVSPWCSGNDWSLVNDHLLVITCNVFGADPIKVEAYVAFDSSTLEAVGETRPSECPTR